METLWQQDAEIPEAQLQKKLRGISANQLSLSNNVFNNNPSSRVDDCSVVTANDVMHSLASVNFPDSVAIVNCTNSVASAANLINSDVNDAGCKYCESSWIIVRAFGWECRSFQSAYVVSRRDVQNWNQTFMTEVRSYASFSCNSISSPAWIIGKRKPEDCYLDIVFAKQSVCSFWKACKI